MHMKNKLVKVAQVTLKRLERNKRKKGQTLVEYALILAFISVVAISVLINLGKQVKSVFSTISSQLAYAGSSH
jgi:Flp pilus assembly pilin Flp